MLPDARPIANPCAVLREDFEGGAVLFNPDTTEMIAVNPVAVAIWKLLDGRRTLADVLTALARDYTDLPPAAAGQVDAFVTDLGQRGFVGYEGALRAR